MHLLCQHINVNLYHIESAFLMQITHPYFGRSHLSQIRHCSIFPACILSREIPLPQQFTISWRDQFLFSWLFRSSLHEAVVIRSNISQLSFGFWSGTFIPILLDLPSRHDRSGDWPYFLINFHCHGFLKLLRQSHLYFIAINSSSVISSGSSTLIFWLLLTSTLAHLCFSFISPNKY